MLLPAGSPDPANRPPLTIWRIDATAQRAAWTRCLTPSEEAQAARLRHPQHQRTWITVRSALRQILAAELRCDPLTLVFDHNAYGKPYLPGMPLHFNVSHSGDLGLIAVSRTHELGIDLEHHRPHLNPADIFPRTFAPEEVCYLETLTGQAQKDAFYRLWVRKEAVIKALGRGLSQSLKSFSALQDDLPGLGLAVADLTMETEGYSAAVSWRASNSNGALTQAVAHGQTRYSPVSPRRA